MSVSKVSVTLGYKYDLIQVCYNATYLHKKYGIKGNIIEHCAVPNMYSSAVEQQR